MVGRKEIKYGAIPTVYGGVQMRSRLEAKVGAFLDSYGLLWNYEPFELGEGRAGYIPDYLVETDFGPLLIECKPAVLPQEFKPACRKVTRSGWVGAAIVIGSQLLLAPDGQADLTLFGSCDASEGGWARVGRGRWPAEWGKDYIFPDVFSAWLAAANLVQWSPPVNQLP